MTTGGHFGKGKGNILSFNWYPVNTFRPSTLSIKCQSSHFLSFDATVLLRWSLQYGRRWLQFPYNRFSILSYFSDQWYRGFAWSRDSGYQNNGVLFPPGTCIFSHVKSPLLSLPSNMAAVTWSRKASLVCMLLCLKFLAYPWTEQKCKRDGFKKLQNAVSALNQTLEYMHFCCAHHFEKTDY